MLEKELETALTLARQAAALILEFYALEIVAEEKFGVDNFSEPVTAADRAASKIIVEGLSAAFPGDAILSEEEKENAAVRLTKKRAWMIDPIDGTTGFIGRNGDFAVQIGLVENGSPVLGIVLLPASGVLYYAVKNQGAFVVSGGAETKLQTSSKTDFPNICLAVSRHHLSSKMSRVADGLAIKNIIRRGSVGIKVGLIAEQTCDLYIHFSPRTKFWDTCAPQIILEESGGSLTDLFGAPIQYDLLDVQNHNGVLASNGAIHEQTVNRLKPMLAEFGRLRIKAQA